MRDKNYYIYRSAYSAAFTILLLYFWMKTTNGKIIIIPFILCGIASLGKNVCMILGNNRFAVIFNNFFVGSFLLYWFGFLCYAAYYSIINKEYSLLLFSIPFWFVGIGILRKLLKRG